MISNQRCRRCNPTWKLIWKGEERTLEAYTCSWIIFTSRGRPVKMSMASKNDTLYHLWLALWQPHIFLLLWKPKANQNSAKNSKLKGDIWSRVWLKLPACTKLNQEQLHLGFFTTLTLHWEKFCNLLWEKPVDYQTSVITPLFSFS